MDRAGVPLDTDPEAFDALVASWRALSTADRVELVEQICADVELLARSGIRHARPELTERGVLHELARRRFGEALADAAYRNVPV